MDRLEKKTKWFIAIIAIMIIAIGCCVGITCYMEEQDRIMLEQKFIEEEEAARAAEEERVLEFEKLQLAAIQQVEEIITSWEEYLIEDQLETLNEVMDAIKNNAKYKEDLPDLIARANEIQAAAEEAKVIQEEEEEQAAALAAQQTYDYSEPTYYSYSYSNSSMSEEDAKEWIAQRESGGSYEATNGQYWGRYQLNSGWYEDVDKDWLLYTDEGHDYQEQQIESYVESRYGSWSNAQQFWQNNGYY